MMMEENFFSLLWDREAHYEEWLRDRKARDGEYIFDLCLERVYEEAHNWGELGDQYDFKEVFLYSCTRGSTIEYRQRIMERLFVDPGLYEAALDALSCISDGKKKHLRIFRIRDEIKRKIFFLQVQHEFLSRMGEIYARLVEGHMIPPGTAVAAGIGRLGDSVAGSQAEEQRKRLQEYLCALHRHMPATIVLNKDENQTCRSMVVCPIEEGAASFTDRLKEAASFFLEDYDYSVKVYQDMDITCLDKMIQGHVCRMQPGLERETMDLYEACIGFDFQPFNRLAEELAFYISCIRFRKQYEGQGFPFVLPECRYGADTKVEGAYDMVLGINLFREGKGFRAVPNDIRFDGEGRIFLLTGANQGGKTTFLRSVGLIQHLAQIGMFVPAREAVLGLVGHIHTHFSRDEDGDAAAGRFEQELERMGRVTEQLEDGDMVLLNESFTSTRRTGAVPLLCGLLREFDRRRCVGGLVTHYHEIHDRLKGGCFYSLTAEVSKDGEGIGRTFRIVRAQPYRQSYARDIAVRCGVTYGQLMQAIEEAEGSEDRDVLF